MFHPNLITEDYLLRFGGIARLYGIATLENFFHSHIMIIGLGGVGSWAAESQARSGIGNITLVDLDDICITNTNRQLPALDGQFGKLKIQAVRDRILLINPHCQVNLIEDFFTEASAEKILNTPVDYVIDAIDSLKNKSLLVQKCLDKNIPIIVTGGAAGKVDPTKIKIADLGLSENDALLSQLRKKLRSEGVFSKVKVSGSGRKQNRPILNIPCVFSDENPRYPTSEGAVCDTPDPQTNLKQDCASGMGSVTHITATFGLMAAGYVINQIALNSAKNAASL